MRHLSKITALVVLIGLAALCWAATTVSLAGLGSERHEVAFAEQADVEKMSREANAAEPAPVGTVGAVAPGKHYLVAVSSSKEAATANVQVREFKSQKEAAAAIPMNSTLLGVLWENNPRGGNSVTLYDTVAPYCDGGFVNLGLYGMSNNVSFYENGCARMVLFFNTSYGGPQQTYGPGSGYVGGGMNDQADSVYFYNF
jgi:hypothetical protein